MKNFTPMFVWLGMGLLWALIGLPALFVLWPMFGPFGMLFCFVCAYACIFRGMFVGNRILNG